MTAAVALTGAGNVTTAANGSASSITFNKPANVADGDLLWALVMTSLSSSTWTEPGGWTQQAGENSSRSMYLYTKPIPSAASESATTYNFSFTGGNGRTLALCGRITGADLSAPIDVAGTATTTGVGSTVAPSVTATTSQGLLLGSYFTQDSANICTITPDAAMTVVERVNVDPGAASEIILAQETLSASGATGTRTATNSPGASSGVCGFLVVIAPIPATNYTATINDVVGLSDTSGDFTIQITDGLQDTEGISDTVTKVLTKANQDTVGITDSTTKIQTKGLQETVGLSDTVTLALTKSVQDAVGLTDTVAASFVISVSVADVVGISDAAVKLFGQGRAQVDSVDLTEVIVVDQTKMLPDVEELSDTVAVSVSTPISDTVGLTDSVTVLTSQGEGVDDLITLTDVITVTQGKSLADTVNIVGAVSKTLSKTNNDNIGLTDDLIPDLRILVGISDSVGITDTITQLTTYDKVISDVVGITEDVSANASGSVGSSIIDLVSIADSITRVSETYRSTADTVGIVDSYTRDYGVGREDVIGVSDTIAISLSKVLNDLVGMLDDSDGEQIYIGDAFDDLITLTDTVYPELSKPVSDIVGITDTFVQLTVRLRGVDDPLSITDTQILVQSKSLRDAIGVTDAVVAIVYHFIPPFFSTGNTRKYVTTSSNGTVTGGTRKHIT